MTWLWKIWKLLLFWLALLIALARYLLGLSKHKKDCDCPNPPPLRKARSLALLPVLPHGARFSRHLG